MLTNKERQELFEIDQERCSRKLQVFSEQAWGLVEPGRRFIKGWHIDAISEHLTAVLNGEIRNIIINIPPRHMKSLLISVLFPAWAWQIRPELRWLFASYAASLSIRDSVKCRRVIQSSWYRERFGHIYQLTGDQNAKEKYENTKTGHRIATSVDGAGTGEGGDIIVIDDPHKVNEAESETVRQGVLDWWDGEMTSRGNDPKTVAKIIVMQRVHEKDLSGHLLAKETGWEHLCLPAEFEPERKTITSIGWEDPRKKTGDLLWPDRFGSKEVEELKKELGSQRSAGQLQQRPAPQEGNIFKREWWKFYKELPNEIDFKAISVDLSFSEGKTNSYAVFQIWGRVKADKYLLDQMRAQIGFNQQLIFFRTLVSKWNPNAKWVEKKANGDALIETVRKEISGIIPITPKGSKVARAEAVAPQVEAGNVYLPDPSLAPWIGDYIEELATFPNGNDDDQVDATTQALSQMASRPIVNYDVDAMSITGPSKWLR